MTALIYNDQDSGTYVEIQMVDTAVMLKVQDGMDEITYGFLDAFHAEALGNGLIALAKKLREGGKR